MATQDSFAESDMENLITKVQSLPPELYDKIYTLTFTVNSNEVCYINETYKPPSILQVNQEWRTSLSPAFYEDTIFAIEARNSHDKLVDLTKWLKSLSKEQRALVPGPEFRILSHSKISTPTVPRTHLLQKEWIGLRILKSRVLQALLPVPSIPSAWIQYLLAYLRFHCNTHEDMEIVFDRYLECELASASIPWRFHSMLTLNANLLVAEYFVPVNWFRCTRDDDNDDNELS